MLALIKVGFGFLGNLIKSRLWILTCKYRRTDRDGTTQRRELEFAVGVQQARETADHIIDVENNAERKTEKVSLSQGSLVVECFIRTEPISILDFQRELSEKIQHLPLKFQTMANYTIDLDSFQIEPWIRPADYFKDQQEALFSCTAQESGLSLGLGALSLGTMTNKQQGRLRIGGWKPIDEPLPPVAGVYEYGCKDQVKGRHQTIYIGSTNDLNHQHKQHLSQDPSPSESIDKAIKDYTPRDDLAVRFIPCSNYKEVEDERLEKYMKKRSGNKPKYNT